METIKKEKMVNALLSGEVINTLENYVSIRNVFWYSKLLLLHFFSQGKICKIKVGLQQHILS